MKSKRFLTRRIAIAKLIKAEISNSIRSKNLDLEKANEVATEISQRLKKQESFEQLNLEFAKIIKDYKILKDLNLDLERLKKNDLDHEIAELVSKLIAKGDHQKALSLGNQVVSVYIRNPDINLDDFRQELLSKWKDLTKKKNLKMHKTIEDKKEAVKQGKAGASLGGAKIKHQSKNIKNSNPVEEGQILQEEDVFSAPGKEEYRDRAEDIKAPEIDLAKAQEEKEAFSKKAKSFVKIFKEATGEVTAGTGTKLKDKAVEMLAKAQEGKKKE